jgi:O-antigen/teichoic acid export membrane protein
VAVLVQVIGTTLEQVLFPRFAAHAPGTDIVRKYVWSAWGTSLVGALVLGVSAPLLVRLVYGPAYSAAATVLPILLLGVVLRAGGSVLRANFKARGKVSALMKANGAGLAVALVALLPLVSLWGMTGAALTNALAAVVEVSILVSAAKVWRQTGSIA